LALGIYEEIIKYNLEQLAKFKMARYVEYIDAFAKIGNCKIKKNMSALKRKNI